MPGVGDRPVWVEETIEVEGRPIMATPSVQVGRAISRVEGYDKETGCAQA
jgi:hypothetical protein